MQYFVNQLQECSNITCKRCDGKIEFTKEVRNGLRSAFHLFCMGCGSKERIVSDQHKNPTQSNVNEAAALGIVSIGSGLYNLQEFCANLNIPYMSFQTFYEIDKQHQKQWWNLAKKLQQEALDEEIQLAIQSGEVDSSGNALIPVKCDGSWHTRSFGSNYKSLAGCAAIIGERTKKILYMDVKSKYCHVCKIAQSKNTPPNMHECNANYAGPSTGMENEIILEGFKYCEEKGARFHKFIGDGDSSTYKNLRDLRLYKDPVVFIEKFDCLNHLDKNFGKKYRALLKNTKFNQTGRQLLNLKMGNDISIGIRMAAKHWNGTNLTVEEKCMNLERDCMNAPLPVFGIHDNCAAYFCSKETTQQSRDFVVALKDSGLYLEVLNLVQCYFANKAKSVLAGYETNIAESFNSLIAKYTGGKRVNNALAGSYKGRTAIAAVHWNTKGQSTSTFQKFKYNNPQQAILSLEQSRKRKVVKNAIRAEEKPKKRTDDEPHSKKKKRAYGEGHEDLDFTPSQLELAKKNFLEQLYRNRQNREQMEMMTRGQRYNSKWSEVRQNMLTSSYFGRILNARNRKSYQKIVEDVLYHNHQYSNSADLVHQHLHEKDGLQIFCGDYRNKQVDVCGIFIDAKYSFLGASPFRLCGQDGIVMVQCPIKIYNKSITDSIKKKLIPFSTVDSSGEIRVNIKSSWYIEVQGQLHIADKKIAYVVVYLGGSEFKIEEVVRDEDFWVKEMENELVFFYNEAMLKELVNSRNERNMELRQYDEISKTFV